MDIQFVKIKTTIEKKVESKKYSNKRKKDFIRKHPRKSL